jgi:hypothetical protein
MKTLPPQRHPPSVFVAAPPTLFGRPRRGRLTGQPSHAHSAETAPSDQGTGSRSETGGGREAAGQPVVGVSDEEARVEVKRLERG